MSPRVEAIMARLYGAAIGLSAAILIAALPQLAQVLL